MRRSSVVVVVVGADDLQYHGQAVTTGEIGAKLLLGIEEGGWMWG